MSDPNGVARLLGEEIRPGLRQAHEVPEGVGSGEQRRQVLKLRQFVYCRVRFSHNERGVKFGYFVAFRFAESPVDCSVCAQQMCRSTKSCSRGFTSSSLFMCANSCTH